MWTCQQHRTWQRPRHPRYLIPSHDRAISPEETRKTLSRIAKKGVQNSGSAPAGHKQVVISYVCFWLPEPMAWRSTPHTFSAVSGKICPCREGSGRLGNDGEEDAMPFVAGEGSVQDEEIYHCLVSLPAILVTSFLNMSLSINQAIINHQSSFQR